MKEGLSPKLVIGVAGLIGIFILLSLAQEMNRRWQIQREVRILEQEARQLEHRVIELEHVNQYFRTPDYQERLAREKLNYRAPGEFVVLIPEDTESDAGLAEALLPSGDTASTPFKWWRMFFVDERPLDS